MDICILVLAVNTSNAWLFVSGYYRIILIMNFVIFPEYRLWPQSSTSGRFGSTAYHDMNVGPSVMGGDEAGESLSYNQRNIKKWETDEPLGDMATISPVLYANICHPDLKIQHPG